VDDFTDLFAHLHSHLSKPLIDLFLFGRELVTQIRGSVQQNGRLHVNIHCKAWGGGALLLFLFVLL
jgi:hypothetical protein